MTFLGTSGLSSEAQFPFGQDPSSVPPLKAVSLLEEFAPSILSFS